MESEATFYKEVLPDAEAVTEEEPKPDLNAVEIMIGDHIHSISSEEQMLELVDMMQSEGLFGDPTLCPWCNTPHKVVFDDDSSARFEVDNDCLLGKAIFRNKIDAIMTMKKMVEFVTGIKKKAPKKVYVTKEVEQPEISSHHKKEFIPEKIEINTRYKSEIPSVVTSDNKMSELSTMIQRKEIVLKIILQMRNQGFQYKDISDYLNMKKIPKLRTGPGLSNKWNEKSVNQLAIINKVTGKPTVTAKEKQKSIKLVVDIIKDLKTEKKTQEEIAEHLNKQGIPTLRGISPWNGKTVWSFSNKYLFMDDTEETKEIIKEKPVKQDPNHWINPALQKENKVPKEIVEEYEIVEEPVEEIVEADPEPVETEKPIPNILDREVSEEILNSPIYLAEVVHALRIKSFTNQQICDHLNEKMIPTYSGEKKWNDSQVWAYIRTNVPEEKPKPVDKKSDKKSKIELNKDKAIKLIRGYLEEGLSQREMAEALNKEKVTNLSGKGEWNEKTMWRVIKLYIRDVDNKIAGKSPVKVSKKAKKDLAADKQRKSKVLKKMSKAVKTIKLLQETDKTEQQKADFLNMKGIKTSSGRGPWTKSSFQHFVRAYMRPDTEDNKNEGGQ
jgi:DNA-binding transcriptional MerR regulator